MSKLVILAAAIVLISFVCADEAKISFARNHGKAYLLDLNEEDKKAYFDIVRSKTLTIAQIEQKKLEFAKAHGFKEDIEKEIETLKKNHEKVLAERPKIIASLPAVAIKLDAILGKRDITLLQQEDEIKNLNKDHKTAVRALQLIASSITSKRNAHGGILGGIVAKKADLTKL